MTGKRSRRALGSVLVLVGAILLAATLFLPWYSIAQDGTSFMSGGGWHIDTSFYLGPVSWDGTIQSSCSAGMDCPGGTSYSSSSLNSTGVLSEIVLLLVVAASAFGLTAGALGVSARRSVRRTTTMIVSAAAAPYLGIIAPVLYAVTIQFGQGGPENSFWGSRSYHGMLGPWSTSWGPSVGWYLSIAAVAVLLVGTVALIRYRGDPARSPPSSVAP